MQAICQPLLWIIAAAVAAGLVRSESPPQSARPTIPAAYRIHGVPFAEPHRDWCGPAALAAVLQYHGEDVNARQIADDIHLPHYRGALTLDTGERRERRIAAPDFERNWRDCGSWMLVVEGRAPSRPEPDDDSP